MTTKNILKIKVDYSTYFIVLIALLSGLFKPLVVIAIILSFHELGHILFIKIFHVKIINISVYPFGIISNMYKELNCSINKDLLIFSGGLLFQIVLYFIIEVVYINNIINFQLYNLFVTYNYSIFIFNLIPIVPLDGYHILNSLINKKISYKKSLYLSIVFSSIFIIIFYYLYPKGSILVIVLLIYKTIKEAKSINDYFNKFCLERYLNKYIFNKFKIINNIEKLYKEKNHYIIKNGNLYSEEDMLKDKYSKF